MTRLGFLLARAQPFAGPIALISALTLASSAATLAVPWLAAQLLGDILQPNSEAITGIAFLLALALIGMTTFNIASSLISSRTALSILSQLRADTHFHIASLPLAFHDRARKGDLIALMTYEVTRLSAFFSGTLARLPAQLFTAAGATAMLLWIEPVAALFVPLLIPVFLVVQKLMGRRIRKLASETRQAEADLYWLGERNLALLPAIKSHGEESAFQSEFASATRKAQDLSYREDRIRAVIGPLIALIAALTVIGLVIGFGKAPEMQSQGQGQGQDPKQLFAFILYAALLTRPLGALVNLYGEYKLAQGTMERLDNVLKQPVEAGYSGTQRVDLANADIAFENVGFAYDEREDVLRNCNLSIAGGEIVALTGENGAGKSTLVRLLLGFYRPQSGRIVIGGSDLCDFDIRAHRRQIGYVPQRALLFDGTLRQNITLNAAQTDTAALDQAVKLAQAAPFIESLSDGLDTKIGDEGVRLSGGQRQRIALARALYTDPPVLVLDEATAMYDAESEADFVAECKEALVGKTVILITHRPASLALANRVIEMRDGRVVETHQAAPTALLLRN
jgi:ATP-binding cassette subfamily B protein/subfamily B ATP-binding cassette protein MsbA